VIKFFCAVFDTKPLAKVRGFSFEDFL